MKKINWKFKKNLDPINTSNGFWYDLTAGGYIRPEKILADEDQIKKIEEAISILENFEKALDEEELLTEF